MNFWCYLFTLAVAAGTVMSADTQGLVRNDGVVTTDLLAQALRGQITDRLIQASKEAGNAVPLAFEKVWSSALEKVSSVGNEKDAMLLGNQILKPIREKGEEVQARIAQEVSKNFITFTKSVDQAIQPAVRKSLVDIVPESLHSQGSGMLGTGGDVNAMALFFKNVNTQVTPQLDGIIKDQKPQMKKELSGKAQQILDELLGAEMQKTAQGKELFRQLSDGVATQLREAVDTHLSEGAFTDLISKGASVGRPSGSPNVGPII